MIEFFFKIVFAVSVKHVPWFVGGLTNISVSQKKWEEDKSAALFSDNHEKHRAALRSCQPNVPSIPSFLNRAEYIAVSRHLKDFTQCKLFATELQSSSREILDYIMVQS